MKKIVTLLVIGQFTVPLLAADAAITAATAASPMPVTASPVGMAGSHPNEKSFIKLEENKSSIKSMRNKVPGFIPSGKNSLTFSSEKPTPGAKDELKTEK